jgi:hypothetical protein
LFLQPTSKIKVLDAIGIKEITTLFLERVCKRREDERSYMSRDEDVRDIITQLRALQLQQTELISRLERSSTSGVNNNTPTNLNPGTTVREFALGDQVRILNPRILQARKGRVVKIGETRITIQASNGTTIVRAPKNIIHE